MDIRSLITFAPGLMAGILFPICEKENNHIADMISKSI
jgi:hypothetical protein